MNESGSQNSSVNIDTNSELEFLREQLNRFEAIADERKQIIKSLEDKNKNLEEDLNKKIEECKILEDNLLNATSAITTHKQKFQPMINEELESDEVVFYDGVIKVISIKSLEQGWKVNLRKDTSYEKRLEEESVILSVVGNYNRGKTWILGKLCEEFEEAKIPQGFSYSTEGISFKYTTKEGDKSKAPVLALDTKGSSTPINIQDVVKALGRADDLTSGENRKKYNDLFIKKYKENLTDHLATEDLLQHFITQISTVNLVIVSSLTFEDQRLINKLKARENNKTMIVVHNLYQCTTIEEIKKVHIPKRIMPSFQLSKKTFGFNCNGLNNEYFQEDLSNELCVVHLIMAQDGTEAGDYYNKNTIEYLRMKFQSEKLRKIDLLRELKSFLEENLAHYLQIEQKGLKDALKITDEDNKKIIKFADINKYGLKQVSSDESGMLQTNIQSYCMYAITEDEVLKMVVKIESPSKFDEKNIRTKVDYNFDLSRITVYGKKFFDDPQDKEMLHDIRREGEFLITTPWFSNKKYPINKQEKSIKYESGSILVIYKCNDSKNDDEWD